MKHLLTFLLVASLVLMTTEGMRAVVPNVAACPALEKGTCCAKDGHAAEPKPDEKTPDCSRCCISCCFVVAPRSAEVTPPLEAGFRWSHVANKGPERNEPPPLPPPRCARLAMS